jgi:hypothetical protein
MSHDRILPSGGPAHRDNSEADHNCIVDERLVAEVAHMLHEWEMSNELYEDFAERLIRHLFLAKYTLSDSRLGY